VTWDPRATFDGLISHAAASGWFDRVQGHEPKNAPGNGLTCAVWGDRIQPIRSSGLDATSMRIAFSIRVYSSLAQEPQDAIDPNIMSAVAALIADFSGDFTLAGSAREIDLLGSEGVPLSAQAGYLNQDGRQYRVMTLTVPVIYNDVFEQVA
jgi:hypothetical protein